MAALRLRDRDAIITKEGLIFRVFGYSHPPNAYICDAEYAPSSIFTSENPKAYRSSSQDVFYKFYEDEGVKFIQTHYPEHLVFHEMLKRKVVGVNSSNIVGVRRPSEKFKELMKQKPCDELVEALSATFEFIVQHSGLSIDDFGVFGSLLHGFHNPLFSDLDFIVYGRGKLAKLRETLAELNSDRGSPVRNEFENDESIRGKRWRFQNLSAKEFVWHQQRKLIYALLSGRKTGRVIKTEFEPVKDWKEIANEYDSRVKILQKGWVRMFAHITDDSDAPFVPSIYGIEPLSILEGMKDADEAVRLVSYIEEFRMQAFKDEKVYLEGNLEEVVSAKDNFIQITLTYCPRYYEQALKVVS